MKMAQLNLDTEALNICKSKLVRLKEDLMNHLRSAKLEISVQEKMSGDEIDQTLAQSIEDDFARHQMRTRLQLIEVETALAKIQRGEFGICEETKEPIEVERLLALPYTRLSIEGAELRESLQKRFARS